MESVGGDEETRGTGQPLYQSVPNSPRDCRPPQSEEYDTFCITTTTYSRVMQLHTWPPSPTLGTQDFLCIDYRSPGSTLTSPSRSSRATTRVTRTKRNI